MYCSIVKHVFFLFAGSCLLDMYLLDFVWVYDVRYKAREQV